MSRPPFHADQVGSLLRPKELHEARAAAKAGKLPPAELKKIEDRSIAHAVKQQEAVGLQAVTDGEFRRDFWHLDFLK
jgi:5-methyltetrahydropteroyltriglutamate--homocysteine methyltransferase